MERKARVGRKARTEREAGMKHWAMETMNHDHPSRGRRGREADGASTCKQKTCPHITPPSQLSGYFHRISNSHALLRAPNRLAAEVGL
jgi:hypothetical protein